MAIFIVEDKFKGTMLYEVETVQDILDMYQHNFGDGLSKDIKESDIIFEETDWMHNGDVRRKFYVKVNRKLYEDSDGNMLIIGIIDEPVDCKVWLLSHTKCSEICTLFYNLNDLERRWFISNHIYINNNRSNK